MPLNQFCPVRFTFSILHPPGLKMFIVICIYAFNIDMNTEYYSWSKQQKNCIFSQKKFEIRISVAG